jgi:hypothetical protein
LYGESQPVAGNNFNLNRRRNAELLVPLSRIVRMIWLLPLRRQIGKGPKNGRTTQRFPRYGHNFGTDSA